MGIIESWALPVILVGIAAGIGWIAGRRSEPDVGGEAQDLLRQAIRPVIVIDGSGTATITPAAAKLLELSVSQPFTAEQLVASLKARATTFCSHLEELLAAGRAFETTLETNKGVYIQAFGAVRGTRAVIELNDQTNLIRRALRAERDLEIARDDLTSMHKAMSLYGIAAWRRKSNDSRVWHEVSDSTLLDFQQTQIVGAADKGGVRRVSTSSDSKNTDHTYQVTFVDNDRNLIAARLIDDVVETENLMNRLVHTMSETFAHLSVGLMIFDNRNRLTLFNPAIIEIFDEKADWLATRPRLGELLDLWRRNGKLPERLDYQNWKERFLKIGRDRDAKPFEERWHLPDSRSLRILCKQHPSGGLAIIVEDITEAVSLIRDTASERAVRSATTELLNQGLLVVGPDNRIRMMNAAFCRIWGLDKDSAIPLHVSGLEAVCRHKSNTPDFWETLGATITGGPQKREPPQKLPMDNGRIITCQSSTMPDGSALAVFSDITATETIALALKERNQALEHADEMRSALLDQTSHRMRTPLNSIYGYGQILAEERFGELNEAQSEYVSAIIASAGELVEVIDEMTDLVSVGQENSPNEAVKIGALVSEIIDLATSRYPDRVLSPDISSIGAALSGDPVKLRQALYNLLIDALGRAGSGDTVECSLRAVDNSYRFQVRHPVREEAAGGLALALARRAIAQCGGALDVVEEPGEPRLIEANLPLSPSLTDKLPSIVAVAE